MAGTTTPRTLVYGVAMSVDHHIAHEDERIDGLLTDGPHAIDYLRSLRDFDTVLMGRRTYDWGCRHGVEPGQPVPVYAHMMQYVFSGTLPAYAHPQLRVIREDAVAFVEQLKAAPGGAIYLSGGGRLAGALLTHGLVDELILKVNPVVFGRGIPAFGALARGVPLSLRNANMYANGVVALHYAVG